MRLLLYGSTPLSLVGKNLTATEQFCSIQIKNAQRSRVPLTKSPLNNQQARRFLRNPAAWKHSSKNRMPPKPCSQARPRALYPGAKKHPARCVNTILPAHFTCGIQIYFFNLVGLRTYLLKYNGCQLAIAENRGFSPLNANTSNISLKMQIATKTIRKIP